ncbi:MAG: hypothetical protein GKR97_08435 [Rhizobiaceae bacterium]|nr:hypothetical protein [Rhizobiaceae bacterium]
MSTIILDPDQRRASLNGLILSWEIVLEDRYLKLFAKSAEHLELLSQMMDRTGSRIDADLSICGTNKIRSAMVACLGCKHVDACKSWLAEAEGEVSPPDFCANVNHLKTMKPV